MKYSCNSKILKCNSFCSTSIASRRVVVRLILLLMTFSVVSSKKWQKSTNFLIARFLLSTVVPLPEKNSSYSTRPYELALTFKMEKMYSSKLISCFLNFNNKIFQLLLTFFQDFPSLAPLYFGTFYFSCCNKVFSMKHF